MSVVDVYNRDVGVAHAVSEEKFAAFIVAKGHTFPFNQLAKTTGNHIHAKWIVLKGTTMEGHISSTTLKTANIPPNALTHLIVTNQAIPYTPAMSDVMDYMFDGNIGLYYPEWYNAVGDMMEELLTDSTSEIQRYTVFYQAIRLRLEVLFAKEVGHISRFVLQKWSEWFFATGYSDGITFGDLILDSIDKGNDVINSIEATYDETANYEDDHYYQCQYI